jgi:hypothetical protein
MKRLIELVLILCAACCYSQNVNTGNNINKVAGSNGTAAPLRCHNAISTASAATVTIPLPACATAGDTVVMVVSSAANLTTLPAGWTTIDSHCTGISYWGGCVQTRTLTTGDVTAGSVSITQNAATVLVGEFLEFNGAVTPAVSVYYNTSTPVNPVSAPATNQSEFFFGDELYYWGANRGSGTVSVNRGAILDTPAAGASVMYSETISTSVTGAITPQFTYGTFSPQGQYNAVIFVSGVGGCRPPVMVSKWSVYASRATGCGGACTDGAVLSTLADTQGGANGSQQGSPVFRINQLPNGLPAAQMTWTTSPDWLVSNIWGTNAPVTFYAVLKPQCINQNCGLTGVANGQTFRHSLMFGIGANTAGTVQTMFWANYYGSGSASDTSGFNVPSTSFSTLAWTYNQPTGAWQFFNCAGGTCNLLSSGTTAATFSDNIGAIGGGQPGGSYFNGYIAEMAYRNTIDITGIAAWSQCKYGN